MTGSPKIIKSIREKFSIKNPSFQSRRFAPRLYAITPSGVFQIGLWNEIEGYIHSLNIPIKIEITDEFKNAYSPNTNIKNISKIDKFEYYDYQEDSIRQLISNGRGIALVATGGGKCFGKGVEMLLYSGETKKVEDIKIGDMLMGPDSKPRKVEKLTTGQDRLFKIKGPNRKNNIEEFTVNSKHILSFKFTNIKKRTINICGKKYRKDDIVNISVEEYIKLSKCKKHVLKAWKPDIIHWHHEECNSTQIENLIDPYFLGVWLGDGHTDNVSITTMDKEIEEVIYNTAKLYNLNVRVAEKINNKAKEYHLATGKMYKGKASHPNRLKNIFNELKLIHNKHIPNIYKFCNEKHRLELLAGLLDSDGHLKLKKDGTPKGFEITQKNKKLADDIVLISRSLGFKTSCVECKKKSQYGTEGTYYRLNISGNLDKIPCKIFRKKTLTFKPKNDPCKSGIIIEEIGYGDYYGFEVSGPDQLFILKDFTVTHNSLIQAGLVKTYLDHYPNYKILLTVPNVSLLNQLYYSFINEFNIQNVTRWGDGNLPDLSKNIIIANNQILINDVPYTLSVVKDFDVVIVDEVHTINEKKNKISKVIHNIITPLKYGLTGTLPDSIMGAWNVIGKIGPIVYEKSSFELRKEQTITDVEVKVIVCQHSTKPIPTKPFVDATEPYLFEFDYVVNCQKRNQIIAKIANSLVGNTLIAVDRLQYIDTLKDALKDTNKKIFVITGDTPTEERTMIQNTMDQEDNIICIAMSKCFSTGISIKNLHYAIFTYMGKGGVKTVQTIGRTVRKHSSKEKAVIFDIADDLQYSLRHAKERLKIYKEQRIKYEITKMKI